MHRFFIVAFGLLLLTDVVLGAASRTSEVLAVDHDQPGAWGRTKASVSSWVRALYVDGRTRESTLGAPHEITERLFVVRRAFRVNDTLPGDKPVAPGWVWQRGGWLLVDRLTGHISAIALPEFDPYYSVASWYRDYAAYCGVSDDGKKLFAIVFQVGRRKPVLKKPLGDAGGDDEPDSECPSPVWERRPVRVTFEPDENQKTTYSVRGHAADLVSDDDAEEEKASQ